MWGRSNCRRGLIIDRLLRLAEEVLSDVAQGVYQCTRYTTPAELQLDV